MNINTIFEELQITEQISNSLLSYLSIFPEEVSISISPIERLEDIYQNIKCLNRATSNKNDYILKPIKFPEFLSYPQSLNTSFNSLKPVFMEEENDFYV